LLKHPIRIVLITIRIVLIIIRIVLIIIIIVLIIIRIVLTILIVIMVFIIIRATARDILYRGRMEAAQIYTIIKGIGLVTLIEVDRFPKTFQRQADGGGSGVIREVWHGLMSNRHP